MSCWPVFTTSSAFLKLASGRVPVLFVNATRSAHKRLSNAMPAACDRHGVLVMDDFSDEWFRSKINDGHCLHVQEWWERDLEAMVAKVQPLLRGVLLDW